VNSFESISSDAEPSPARTCADRQNLLRSVKLSSARSQHQDLTLRLLSGQAPEEYRTWLRAGIWAGIIGYSLSIITQLATQGLHVWSELREPYVVIAGFVALWLERDHRQRTAAALSLGALWLELHVTLAFRGPIFPGAAAFPVAIVGATLFLGVRCAMLMGLSSIVSIPSAMAARPLMGTGPWLPASEINALVILLASLLTTAGLLALFMRSFSRVLARSEQSASQARALLDGAPDAIISINDRGLIEDCNPTAERLLGVAQGDVLGSSLGTLGLRDADKNAAAAPSIGTMTDRTREYVAERTGLTLEGRLRTVPKPGGKQGSLIVLRDVTQRKLAERRAVALQHQLQHSQKLEAIGQLAGGVAHDINNLLTAVGGYGDLLSRHPERFIRDTAQELISARERGTGLTRQLLTFARKELAQPRGIDVAEVVGGLDRLLTRIVGEQITLDLDLRGPAIIYSDPGQIEQVVLNLTMNARDAMPDGGVLRIRCQHEQGGSVVQLVVEDTGVGMDEAVQRRIFEPFFTTKPRGQGTGLGLSTVHGIVESSGGTIAISSKVGTGSRFTLSWPSYDVVEVPERTSTPPELPETRRGRILLVEDDPQSRTFLVQLLGATGYEVTVAVDGSKALSAFEELRRRDKLPDLLLSDVRMPGISGIQLAEMLRKRSPDLPVLFISGYVDQTLDDTGFDPVRDLLLKPFSTATLLDRLERKLGRTSTSSMTLAAQRDSSPPESATPQLGR